MLNGNPCLKNNNKSMEAVSLINGIVYGYFFKTGKWSKYFLEWLFYLTLCEVLNK